MAQPLRFKGCGCTTCKLRPIFRRDFPIRIKVRVIAHHVILAVWGRAHAFVVLVILTQNVEPRRWIAKKSALSRIQLARAVGRLHRSTLLVGNDSVDRVPRPFC